MDTLLNIGIDIGGTFTDFVIYNTQTGSITTFKVLSTPQDPSQALLQGLRKSGQIESAALNRIVHGSTVATNALLERKGATTALVTTRGFRDILQIGRQNRPSLYELKVHPLDPLVDQALRFEVDERVGPEGTIIQPLGNESIDAFIRALKQTEAESVAICLLFSFLHPEHEQRISAKLSAEGYYSSASHEISPEFREYERMSTTVINAYVTPILDQYLENLEGQIKSSMGEHSTPVQIMQSNGGIISIDEARHQGVRCILSGPAGGIIGSCYVAQRALAASETMSPAPMRLITFDMGGTSTDVSVVDHHPLLTTEASIGGYPIRTPLLDIHTIGAGGGSIGWVDLGGALRVGPQSAGADPGPACYGRSDPTLEPGQLLPTVTDANLLLGRILPDHFLGGKFVLNPDLARKAVSSLGVKMGLSPLQAALGIIAVVDAHMERALRLVSIERGYDPRMFTLVAFGGAGGLHASSLARRLGVPQILVPPFGSVLSALGMLSADIEKDFAQTVMLPGDTLSEAIDRRIKPLLERGKAALVSEGVSADDIQLQSIAEVRYKGQSYELPLAWPPSPDGLAADFVSAHQKSYGYSHAEAELEIVNLRVRAIGKVPPIQIPEYPHAGPDPSPAAMGVTSVVMNSLKGQVLTTQVPCYKGEVLRPLNNFSGPALVVRDDTTIFLQPGDQAVVDRYLNLWIHVPEPSENNLTAIPDYNTEADL